MNNILIAALMLVESSCNTKAINEKEQAYGCLQVRQPVLDDVNRIYHTTYTLNDMLDWAKAVDVFGKYMEIYATPKRLGRAVRAQDMARIWNGGPNGWRMYDTLKYWHKVAAKMNSGERHNV